MGSIKVKVIVTALVTIILSIPTAKGQTWDEMFSQKKTQIRYLGEQLVALKLYAGYVKKGYEVVSTGVSIVKNIKDGEFDLHNAFIASLSSVSPAIRSNAKIAEIIVLQLAISKSFNAINSNTHLSANDQEYISRVRMHVREECLKDLEELLLIVTSGKVEMKDDERLERLDKIYRNIKDKSAFTQSFTGNVRTLICQRRESEREANTTKKLYGITQ